MKTIVCTPYFGPKDLAHDDCMRELRRTHDVLEARDVPWIDQARAILVKRALGLGADVVVFIDHDIVFKQTDVVRIAEQAHERKAVVAGAYSRKQHGQPLVGAFDPSVSEAVFYEGGGLYLAHAVGLGFTAIPASVFALMAGYPEGAVAGGELVRPYFLPSIEGGHYLGEDAAFCRRVRLLGGSMLIDTTLRLLHRGQYAFAIEDAQQRTVTASSITVSFKESEK